MTKMAKTRGRITYSEFMEILQKGNKREWRYGQALFNYLSLYRPDLSEQIRGTELDPFYSVLPSPKIVNCLDWIEKNWN